MCNLKKKDIIRLESLDRQLLTRCLELSSKVTNCLLMLELALTPLRFIIMKKRILNFFRLITGRKDNLARKIIVKQMEKPKKNDIILDIFSDLKIFGIEDKTIEFFESFSKIAFKRLVNERMREVAFKYLLEEKLKKKKGKELIYDKLEIQNYLKPESLLTSLQQKRIMTLRVHDLQIASNFSHKFTSNLCVAKCPEIGSDSQFHLFTCSILQTKNKLIPPFCSINYEEIYLNNSRNQEFVMTLVFKAYKKRCEILSSLQEDPKGIHTSFDGSRRGKKRRKIKFAVKRKSYC